MATIDPIEQALRDAMQSYASGGGEARLREIGKRYMPAQKNVTTLQSLAQSPNTYLPLSEYGGNPASVEYDIPGEEYGPGDYRFRDITLAGTPERVSYRAYADYDPITEVLTDAPNKNIYTYSPGDFNVQKALDAYSAAANADAGNWSDISGRYQGLKGARKTFDQWLPGHNVAEQGEFQSDIDRALRTGAESEKSVAEQWNIKDDPRYSGLLTGATTTARGRINAPTGNDLGAVYYDPQDYSPYFAPDAYNEALTGEQNKRREGYLGQVNQFRAPGAEHVDLEASMTDPLESALLGTSRDRALRDLENQSRRFGYSDAGANAARRRLEGQAGGVSSKIDEIAGNLLASKQQGLRSISDEARGAASGFQLAQPDFALDPYQQRYEKALTEARSELPSELTSLVSGTPLFDVGTTGRDAAGIAQLVNRRKTDSVKDVLAARDKDRQGSRSRGLGSTGEF